MKSKINTVTQQMKELERETLSREEKRKLAAQVIFPLFAVAILITGLIFRALFKEQKSIAEAGFFIAGVIASLPVFVSAIKGLMNKEKTFVMDQLISVALLAAMANGEFITVVLIPFIMSIVHFLEERSILGARSAIDAIKTLQAKQACLITENGDSVVPTEDLKVYNHIRVKPGDMFPVDGKIVKGYSSIDQSSLTGETTPVEVKEGDEVFAGTLNLQGYLEVVVTKRADETSISKIVEIMQEAESSKPPIVKIIDKYVYYYTPVILIIAVAVLFVTGSIDRVITVLVASCPCALLLVSSSAMVSAISVSSKNGILIKNSAFLEKAGRVKNVLFDKTGTITEGKLKVLNIKPSNQTTSDELIWTAFTAAQGSNHPISKAIINYVNGMNDKKQVSVGKLLSIEEEPGYGTIAKTTDGDIYLGRKSWIELQGIKIEEDQHSGTEVWVLKDKKVLGNIILSDTLRANAHDTIEQIRNIGINSVVMVTGDRRKTAEEIKEKLALDRVYFECLPSDKLDIVESEKAMSEPVMMIGDGVNDALAMVKADISISMGAMGSEIAIRSSDIALMTNDLRKIPFIIRLSRKTTRVVYRNIIIAFLTSAIMLTLAVTGVISPISGAIFHNIGAILVIISSASLLSFEKNNDK